MKQFANVSNTNSKLGAQILSINMPAGITCRPDARYTDYVVEAIYEVGWDGQLIVREIEALNV